MVFLADIFLQKKRTVRILFFLIFFLLSQTSYAQKTMKLIYVYDPLCGWCYGFSPVIEAFVKKYQADFEVEVISGGMVTGDRIGPIGEVAPYIAWAYKDVENATGVKFGSNFLDHVLKKGTAIFTSLPASYALTAFKTLKPAEQLSFAARLQKAVYFDGFEPLDTGQYGLLAAEFGLQAANFLMAMQSPKNLAATHAEFAMSQKLGVRGFPTVFLKDLDTYYNLAKGAVSLKILEQNYLSVKSMLKR
jgi:putative protein-disulfide isomerase